MFARAKGPWPGRSERVGQLVRTQPRHSYHRSVVCRHGRASVIIAHLQSTTSMRAKRTGPLPAAGIYASTIHMVNNAAERERIAALNPFDRIREKAFHRFAAIRAETHEGLEPCLRFDHVEGDDILF